MSKEKRPVAETHEAHVLPVMLKEVGAAVGLAILFGSALTLLVLNALSHDSPPQ